MEDQLVSFETAKLAKEKGFIYMKSNCFGDNMCYKLPEEKLINSLNGGNNYILAPRQSLLQRWLREFHNLNVEVTHHGYNKEDKHFSFRCKVKLITETKEIIVSECISSMESDFYIFRSYETALEEGLLQALKLIK